MKNEVYLNYARFTSKMQKREALKLSESEKKLLHETSMYHPKPEVRMRCQGLLLNDFGMNQKNVAKFMNISENTFVNWKKAWLSEGLNGLIRKEGQGRKQIISLDNPQHLEVIEEALKDESINLKALQKKLLQELDISVSIDTVKRLVKNRLSK